MVHFEGKTPEKKWKAGFGPEALLASFLEDDPNFAQRAAFTMGGSTWVYQPNEVKRGFWDKVALTIVRLLVDKRIGTSVTIGSRRFVHSMDSENF